MQLYQNPIDEQLLWEYLQTEQWSKATELIDWYYSSSNPEGFDDPKGIIKADFLLPSTDVNSTFELPLSILRGRLTYKLLLYALGFVYAFFGFISYKVGTINVMFIPAILIPIVPIAIYNLIKKTTEIVMTDEHLEFRKSNRSPIVWENILAVYYYHRGTGGIVIGPGQQAADFVLIWKKNAVKPESYYLNHMEYVAEDIVYLINQVKKRKTANAGS